MNILPYNQVVFHIHVTKLSLFICVTLLCSCFGKQERPSNKEISDAYTNAQGDIPLCTKFRVETFDVIFVSERRIDDEEGEYWQVTADVKVDCEIGKRPGSGFDFPGMSIDERMSMKTGRDSLGKVYISEVENLGKKNKE